MSFDVQPSWRGNSIQGGRSAHYESVRMKRVRMAQADSVLSVLAFSLSLRAAMAAHAIFNIANAFLGMLGDDLRGLMLVTAIAGVALELFADVAGRARHLVVGVEPEVAIMGKTGRRPSACRMALRAFAGDGGMEAIIGLGVARDTLLRDARLKQVVRKAFGFALREQGGSMIRMAGHAIGAL